MTADAFAAEDQRGCMSVCAVPGQNPHMFKRSLIEISTARFYEFVSESIDNSKRSVRGNSSLKEMDGTT